MATAAHVDTLGAGADPKIVHRIGAASPRPVQARAGPILLVVPPFQTVLIPALGVSQLKANLEAQGFPTEILYLNFRFAHRIGLDIYGTIGAELTDSLFGEFIFSHVLFERADEDVERYVAAIRNKAEGIESISPIENLFPGQNLTRAVRRLIGEAAEFCRKEAVEEILKRDPWMVGLTSSFQQNCSSLAIIREVKRARPEILTALGGANCESEMGEELFALFPEVDYVGQSECDHSLVNLVRSLQNGEAQEPIPGILSRNAAAPAAPPQPLRSEDLDALPYPDFSDFFSQLSDLGLRGEIKAGLVMETSRGCWWGAKHHCTFCGLNGEGMGFRSKSPSRALSEMTALVERYGVRHIQVVDNILDNKYLKTVLPQLAENPVAELFYEVKANLSREQIRLLSDAHVRYIQPGLESLSDRALKLMRKGTTEIQNVSLLKWCAESGIHVGWNYLMGFPGEDDSELARIAADASAVHHLEPPTGAAVLHLDRFSPYFNSPQDWGIESIYPAEAYRHVYPISDGSLSRIAYFFDSDYLESKKKSLAFKNLRAIVATWHDAHPRSHLVAIPRRKSLILIDTRPCSKRFLRRLTGLHRRVYEFCERAQSRANIIKEFESEATGEELLKVLESFTEDRTMLAVDDIFLSLATDPLYRYKQYPDGYARLTVKARTTRDRVRDLLAFRIPPRRLLAAVRYKLSRLRCAMEVKFLSQVVAALSKVLGRAQ